MDAKEMQRWLEPVSGESPGGPNLEYDAAFAELERTAQPTTEVVLGDTVKPAEEPPWPEVERLATALLGRTRDLRVALRLTTAWLRLRGLPGLADGLGLMAALLTQFWDSVHPQLDAEDGNDPTLRINSLLGLNDADGTLRYLRQTPFAVSPRLGRFGLRDLRIAEGKLTPVGDAAKPQLAEIEGACADTPVETLGAVADASAASLAALAQIEQCFTEKLGAGIGPEFTPLRSDLQEIERFLRAQLGKRQPSATVAVDAAAGFVAAVASAASGPINGHQDVLRRLEEICDYYQRSEPSSPVPLLLNRAKRLVGKDFISIIQDLAPGGVSEVQTLRGNDGNG